MIGATTAQQAIDAAMRNPAMLAAASIRPHLVIRDSSQPPE